MKFNSLKKANYFLNLGKPNLLFKLFFLYGKLKLFGRVPPFRNIEIQTTFACNLRCVHCSASTFSKEKRLLGIEDYRKISEQCRQYRIPFVSFTGGEPLVDPRLLDILKCFNGSDTLLAITTNGTLFTDDYAKKLKRVGVSSVTISLDGATAEENDAIRGNGTFDKILDAISISKQNKLSTMVIYTLSHPSIASGGFDRMLALSRKLDVPMHVSLACPTGNWASKKSQDEFLITKEDIAYLNKCQDKYPFLRRDIDGNYCKRGCPAGSERFVISPCGDVLTCTKIQATFGNVKNEKMIDVRNRIMKMKLFSEYPPLCLVAEDQRFLTTYLPRLYGREDLPINSEEYFAE